jgi:hypothetical protein
MPKNPLEKFDYRVECDDFLLYELGRLIEEDRATLEDEEFRKVIDAGIHEHIERRLDVRAAMAKRVRMSGVVAGRTLNAIEDIEASVRESPPIIHSYTAYLFDRLEQCAAAEPDERVTSAADTLFEETEDRAQAEASIHVLGSIRSAVSSRVLAHAISEPMLEEDLEMKAYDYVRAMWPLPRHYILYSLRAHSHEDIPFRWFQLLIDCSEPSAVDRILEEVLVHATNANYREDLLALIQLLEQARDPDTDDKILQVLNSENTPRAAAEMLEGYLKNTTRKPQAVREGSPWAELDRVYAANRRYLAAARMFDSGKRLEAARALDELLHEEPQYPFAVMLKQLL